MTTEPTAPMQKEKKYISEAEYDRIRDDLRESVLTVFDEMASREPFAGRTKWKNVGAHDEDLPRLFRALDAQLDRVLLNAAIEVGEPPAPTKWNGHPREGDENHDWFWLRLITEDRLIPARWMFPVYGKPYAWLVNGEQHSEERAARLFTYAGPCPRPAATPAE